MNKLKNAIAGLALATGALAAAPATAATSWGTHDAVEFGVTSSFISSFDFTLSSLSSLTTTVSTASGGGALGLFQGGNLLGGLIYTSALSGVTGVFSNLAPGAYSYKVLNLGGPTTIVSSVSAVPELETYAMLLAGLGMIGLVARRRLDN